MSDIARLEDKIDLLLACFGIGPAVRSTPSERQAWAKSVVVEFHNRKKLKSSPAQAIAMPSSGEETGENEREEGEGP